MERGDWISRSKVLILYHFRKQEKAPRGERQAPRPGVRGMGDTTQSPQAVRRRAQPTFLTRTMVSGTKNGPV